MSLLHKPKEVIKPTTPIEFHWLDPQGRRHKLVTSYKYFKNYAIEFLEQEQVDIVYNVHYTLGNITVKLDYYNEVL